MLAEALEHFFLLDLMNLVLDAIWGATMIGVGIALGVALATMPDAVKEKR